MAKTQIADIFVPEVWEQYFIERTAESANFGASGLVQRTPEFDALAAGPGKTVDMPFWTDITGAREVLSDTNALTPAKIVASKDEARIHNDAKAWSTNLLAELLAGDDPMAAIVSLVGDYWARVDEDMLIATVNGVLASLDAEDGDPNLLTIASESIAGTTAATTLTDLTFLDALQKLGDVKDRLTAIAMHSAVENDLSKQDQIDFIPNSQGSAQIRTFKGLPVIMDDDLVSRVGTTDGAVYTTVLFGTGAIARGFNALTKPLDGGFGTEGVEMSRVPLNSDNVLINRRRHILHPRGMAWQEASIAEHGGPSDAELAEAAQWDRVFESKNIRIVGIRHNLTSQIDAGS